MLAGEEPGVALDERRVVVEYAICQDSQCAGLSKSLGIARHIRVERRMNYRE